MSHELVLVHLRSRQKALVEESVDFCRLVHYEEHLLRLWLSDYLGPNLDPASFILSVTMG